MPIMGFFGSIDIKGRANLFCVSGYAINFKQETLIFENVKF